MGIYAGVNGAVRKATQPRAGINAAVRTVSHGFNGVQGVRQQFFGPLEDVARVEVRPDWIAVSEVDSSGNWGASVYSGTSIAEASKYGSITITSNSIGVSTSGSVKGKFVTVYGHAYAVFENGREVPLHSLSVASAEYGAAISLPVGYYISTGGSSYSTGRYTITFSEPLYNSYVNESISGTKTFSSLTWNDFSVGSTLISGSGTQSTRMSFSNITIDGRTVPVKVVSQLT